MTVSRVERGGLRIAQELDDLVKNSIAPGTGIDVEAFGPDSKRALTN